MLNSLDGIMLKHDDKVSLVGDLLSNTGCKKKPLFLVPSQIQPFKVWDL